MTEQETMSSCHQTVAVVIPTFNHAHFLSEAITSVLSQTRKADEIIVVDDGSKDNPNAVVEKVPQITFIRQENRGLAAARNTGLKACSAEYVVFLDADDRLLPHALESGVDCIARHPECAFAYGGYRLIETSGREIGIVRPTPIVGNAYLAMLQRDAVLGIMTMVHRRECLEAVGGFDEMLRTCEDLDLKLRITRTYPIVCHAEIVAEYRRHDQNMSARYSEMLDTALAILNHQTEFVRGDRLARAALREGRFNRQKQYISCMFAAASCRWKENHKISLLLTDLFQIARRSPILAIRGIVGSLRRRTKKMFSSHRSASMEG